GELVPGNLPLLVETDLQAFGTDAEILIEQAGAKGHVYLRGVQQVRDRQQRADLHARQRLFERFACGRLRERLANLVEARRECPVASPRIDGALAEQDATVPFRDATHDDARVLIMDCAAGLAHRTGPVIARRDAQLHRPAAVWTEFHDGLRYRTLPPRPRIWPRGGAGRGSRLEKSHAPVAELVDAVDSNT